MIPLRHPKSGGTHVATSEREAAALRLHGWVDDVDDTPSQSDTKAVWAAYRGVDPDDFTKQQLIDGDI